MANINGILVLLVLCLVAVFADTGPLGGTLTKRAETSPSDWRGSIGLGTGDATSTDHCKPLRRDMSRRHLGVLQFSR